jgi:two-component system NtrC family sensor kinase
MADDVYKKAYEREKTARLAAEKLLDEKTREVQSSMSTIQYQFDELKKAQGQLVQSEKMASLGQLAAGVAHEINNPIGFVISNVSTLNEYAEVLRTFIEKSLAYIDTPEDTVRNELAGISKAEDLPFVVEDIMTIVKDAQEGLTRVKDIVANLKQFARTDEDESEAFDLNDNIENTIKVAWNELKYHATLIKEFDDSLPHAFGHPGQVNQVILNMLVNAAQAIESDGEIRIRTKATDQHIVLEIEDNGCGMPDDVQAKIFDPFFTTKPVNVGTGLGLSISYGIIEKQGGKIEVRSEVGKGTCFTILLPIADE